MMAVELPREEVALLLGTLTACGFLILGVLEIMWPAASRKTAVPSSRSSAPRPIFAAPRPAPAARLSRPTEAPRPLPAPPPAPPTQLEIARLLLARARAEADLERRVTILNRAVAGLTRTVQAAPEDETLSEMLATMRALLWETWERIALARLPAATPWNGEILAAETTTVLTRTR